jgi:hypothetical protein
MHYSCGLLHRRDQCVSHAVSKIDVIRFRHECILSSQVCLRLNAIHHDSNAKHMNFLIILLIFLLFTLVSTEPWLSV